MSLKRLSGKNRNRGMSRMRKRQYRRRVWEPGREEGGHVATKKNQKYLLGLGHWDQPYNCISLLIKLYYTWYVFTLYFCWMTRVFFLILIGVFQFDLINYRATFCFSQKLVYILRIFRGPLSWYVGKLVYILRLCCVCTARRNGMCTS